MGTLTLRVHGLRRRVAKGGAGDDSNALFTITLSAATANNPPVFDQDAYAFDLAENADGSSRTAVTVGNGVGRR